MEEFNDEISSFLQCGLKFVSSQLPRSSEALASFSEPPDCLVCCKRGASAPRGFLKDAVSTAALGEAY